MIVFDVLRQPRYAWIAGIAFFLVGLVSAFTMVIVSWPALVYDHILVFAPEMLWFGIPYWLVFSALASLTITLTIYRYERLKRAELVEGFGGILGLAIGSISSACPLCAPLLLVMFGLPLSLASLPFNGWEFRIGGLLLLALSAYFTARNADRDSCSVPVKAAK